MKKLFVFIGILLLAYSIINKEVTENQLVDINKSNTIKNKKIVNIKIGESNASLNVNETEKTSNSKKENSVKTVIEKTKELVVEKRKVENSKELVMEKEDIEEMLEQEKHMQKLFEPKSEELTPEYIEKMIEEQEALMEEYDN